MTLPLGFPLSVILLSPSGNTRNSHPINFDFNLEAIFFASCSEDGPPITVKSVNNQIEPWAILKFYGKFIQRIQLTTCKFHTYNKSPCLQNHQSMRRHGLGLDEYLDCTNCTGIFPKDWMIRYTYHLP